MDTPADNPPGKVAPDASTPRAFLDLLHRHKLVEKLVHEQNMPRHDLVESLVHKQNVAELQRSLASLTAAQIAQILQAIPAQDRDVVWPLVDADRHDGVLATLPDQIRESLVLRAPLPRRIGLNAFELSNGRLRQLKVESATDLTTSRPLWVDLVAPSERERAWVKEAYELELPDPAELTDLESSARFYVADNGEIHLHTNFLLEKEDGARNVPVALILHRDILFSVRSEELPVFRLQRMRARTQPGYVSDGKDVLLDLYAADAEYSADALEDVYAALEATGKQVLTQNMSDTEAARALAGIALAEDLNGRIRRNVNDTRRGLSFLMRSRFLSPGQVEDARQILRDIESLDGHTAFLFDKINFLMDATVGFININQNKIIKLFSVASVALLPPTLIASIYGMNFKGIPELQWDFGYPYALALMVASVAAPFWYFWHKGWLR